MKYSVIVIAVGILILTVVLIGHCQNSASRVEELLNKKIALLEQATDILYNERTHEGKAKLIKINFAEKELQEQIDALSDSERRKIDNNSKLKEANERFETAKKDRVKDLLNKKIALLEQATDILYNERTHEGTAKLIKINSTEKELQKQIDALFDSERNEIDNNLKLKETKEHFETTKKERVEELLKEMAALLEQATDILYNERTHEGKAKLIKINSAEKELQELLNVLTNSEYKDYDNYPKLEKAINHFNTAKKDTKTGL